MFSCEIVGCNLMVVWSKLRLNLSFHKNKTSHALLLRQLRECGSRARIQKTARIKMGGGESRVLIRGRRVIRYSQIISPLIL